jgi:hypothetical protein
MELISYLWKEGYVFLLVPIYMWFFARFVADGKIKLSEEDKKLDAKLSQVGGVILILFFFIGKYVLKLSMFHTE